MTASNPDDFALKVKGIQSTSDLAMEGDESRKPGGSTVKGTIGGARTGVSTPARPTPKDKEAKEYTGGSGDSDFKIDRFGQ